MNEIFDWNYPGLKWSHFHALANLLSLRNGGQAERSSLPDAVLEEDWDPHDSGDEDQSSVNTGRAHQISDSGHEKLKKRFLDCLAEFAANKKGGEAVACSAMKEAEDSVVIWISRNQGFSKEDEPMFENLEKMLASLSDKINDQSEIRLWEHMVSYHENRIKESYIPNLRACFKAYDAKISMDDSSATGKDSDSDGALSVLRDLLFNSNTNSGSTFEKHAELVMSSYNLRRRRDIEELFNSSPSATAQSKNLWREIGLLARLRVAFHTFEKIALKLPSFERVNIKRVPNPPKSANPRQRPLNLKQTFGILQLDLSPTTTKAVLGLKWGVSKIENEFTKLQKLTPNIHAEVQMLMYLNTEESSASGLFPYFGCSKFSCFMCNRFIQSYARFRTRGCHGRLFKPWTVPMVDRLLSGQADRTAKALISVQKEVEKALKASFKDHIQLEPTSAIGGSSVFSDHNEQQSEKKVQIDQLEKKATRDRVSDKFRRQTENAGSPARRIHSIPEVDKPDTHCSICERPTTRKCSLCNQDFFCSYSCQDKRFEHHLFTCSQSPLTSADYLWLSLAEDRLPEVEDVLEDFRFNNFATFKEKSNLGGVYAGLYLSQKFSARDIHAWRIGGILFDKIKEFYNSIPENSRGGYFPWFLKNLNVLERPTPAGEAKLKLVATLNDSARPYLDIEDRHKTAKNLKPEAKAFSYILLSEISLWMSPNPIERNWYSFGFVTCRGEHEESTLVSIYVLLLTKSDGSLFYKFHNERRGDIPPATFFEFWQSYEAGTLIQLMDSKGLKPLRSQLPYLEAFLSAPPAGSRPSVWDLKHFLDINGLEEHPPTFSVDVDYGFSNCRSFEDTCTLKEIYGKVLQTADPLELHRACVAGDLFQFASRYVRMKEQWRALMRNPYPLDEVESGLEP